MSLTGWAQAARLQLAGSIVRPGFFLFVNAAENPVRAWSSVGSFDMAPNLIDAEGGEYQGVGTLIGLPAVSQLLNGVASRVQFTLSGLTDQIRQLADEEIPGLRGADAHLGFTAFDEDWQPLGPIVWIWEGECDSAKTSWVGQQGGATSAVSLSVGSPMTGRKRPGRNYWTGRQQQARHPGDLFCDRTTLYNAGTTTRWPT